MVLKRDLGQEDALQYQRALQNAGAKVRVEDGAASGLAIAPAPIVSRPGPEPAGS